MIEAIISFITVYYVPLTVGYIVGGVVYAFAKWMFCIAVLRSRILNAPKAFEGEDLRNWRRDQTMAVFDSYEYPPQVSNNKARLFGWAFFWPINLVWSMVADVITESFKWIYRKFGENLQKLSDSILPK